MKIIFILLLVMMTLPLLSEELIEPEKKPLPMDHEIGEGLFLIPAAIAFAAISIDAFAQARDIKKIPNYQNSSELTKSKNRKTFIGVTSGLAAAGSAFYLLGKIHKSVKENTVIAVTPNSVEICFNF